MTPTRQAQENDSHLTDGPALYLNTYTHGYGAKGQYCSETFPGSRQIAVYELFPSNSFLCVMYVVNSTAADVLTSSPLLDPKRMQSSK